MCRVLLLPPRSCRRISVHRLFGPVPLLLGNKVAIGMISFSEMCFVLDARYSPAVKLLSYSPPIITAVTGCHAAPVSVHCIATLPAACARVFVALSTSKCCVTCLL